MTSTPGATEAPVFVFGADHSGTTILYRMLAYHPRLVWFSQFTLRGGEISGRPRRPGAGLAEPLAQSMRRFVPHPWQKEELSRLRRLITPRPGEEGQIWDSLLEGGAGAEGIRACLTEFSRRLGGRRVLAKRPASHRHLHLLAEAFPQAAFVHIVRDGRPVALSLQAKWLSEHAPGSGGDASGALRAGAESWVEVIDHVAEAPEVDLFEVRYEDLCADVHGVVGSVLERFGLPPADYPFQRIPGTLTNRSGRWLDGARPDDLAEVERIQRRALLRYGYPLGPEGPSRRVSFTASK